VSPDNALDRPWQFGPPALVQIGTESGWAVPQKVSIDAGIADSVGRAHKSV